MDGHEGPRRCIAEYCSYVRADGRCGWNAEPGRSENDRPNRATDQDSQREANDLYNTALFQTIITHCLAPRSSTSSCRAKKQNGRSRSCNGIWRAVSRWMVQTIESMD